ncbi:MAG: lipopolysaccharide heptosyltransferase II, partial [Verrucomicrobiota bacterium]|nr:lipopolysaccharide heptosyltransferase II [Verrucomicrobiota bacterium]
MDRVVYAIYRLIANVFAVLPVRLVFCVGWALGALAYYVAVPYRRLVLHNLEIAFGAEQPARERRALARRHFAALGANLCASIKLPRMPEDRIFQLVTVEGLEHMEEPLAEKRGFVFVLSHIGNWELFAQIVPSVFRCKVGTVFQQLGNPYLDAEVRRDRARLGLELFERKEGFAAATKFLREGGAVGVLIDQHAGDAGLWCPFFNRLASTTTLAATLALRSGAVLIPAAVYTVGIARWRCRLLPPLAFEAPDPVAITVQMNQVLEQQIRREPTDWFWMHNRWKTPSPKFLLATYKRGVALPPPGERRRALQPFRILIRSPNWLGDAVMSILAVRAIKRGRPDAHVTVLAPAKLADLWSAEPAVDDVIPIRSGEGVGAVAFKLRRREFDVAVLLPNSLRAALEVWLARIPRRVGHPGHARRWLLNQPLLPRKKQAPAPPRHQVHQFIDLARFIGAEVPKALEFPTRQPRAARRQPILGLCPGAEYGGAKCWLPERYAEVIRRVAAECDGEWVLFGTAKDAEIGEAATRGFFGQCRNLIGQTTLAQLISELRRCDVLLTNDTGTMHLAALVGVPAVAIFGSTEPALTRPLGLHHQVLRHHVPCSPCFLRECPLDFRCMKAITVEEVVSAT